ncbi:extracellular solute-binding protein family 1 [Beutenbergia cavernae DSM 12333]|uniref:Extracellular solute-binding protein family 1 n=1 Tax=Beutenbergia cavernae (strain ATCC BAA-8 / DSM 12333 / CCUG 43141 / JCM 11478 / NBRC 16432 / NCIMB 13614 / HKI 0122) TaxID=471853 RepID=C5BZB8_BEUC1|nr:extracellular solute-binding protein [Beutenbergia cavernae]ACQ79090.1 extracellular solute-binding protein family 1 [Beutenbergia cavernae DSM 12333]
MPPLSAEITRRAALGTLGAAGLTGLGLAWPRLTGRDIPGRGEDVLTIAILGTSQDAAARQDLVAAFNEIHPDIPVRVQGIQGNDWGDFFSKILTMIAAGTPPDLVNVATEGTQLFASLMAEPLDDYVLRDAAELQEYFDDVHPTLLEAFMYEGSLFQLPTDFNAANMYYNVGALELAGLDRPADDWTHDDFVTTLRAMRSANAADFVPYFWTNRLFGGLVPWLYVNDTSFLAETKAGGGTWFWDRFYPGEQRSGGYRWLEPNADDPRVEESVEFLRELVADGLGTRPEEGGGGALVGLFASGRIGTTPAGGYWVQGLNEAGMAEDEFDVQFFPRWRTQRHQFGAAGYAIMSTSPRKDEAWEWIKFTASRDGMELAYPLPSTTPTRRSMVNEARYAGKGPRHWEVFYDTLDRFPTTGPIPAPPQQAAVETALIKNISAAVGGSASGVPRALANLQRDLTQALGRTA